MSLHENDDERFPWQEGRAAPEDRALGLELELIELVRRRDDIADEDDPEAIALSKEITSLQNELREVAAITPDSI